MIGKAVTGTPDSLYQVVLAEGFQRLAQTSNMHIHSTLFNINIGTPDAIEQLPTCKHPFPVVHKMPQQLEFGSTQHNSAAVNTGSVTFLVQ